MAKKRRIPILPVRRPRGLLVEDSPEQLDRRADLLRLRDIDVTAASSKEEAFLRLNEGGYRFDVVVTDLDLGDIDDGVDVARSVVEVSGDAVPVFAYSGKASRLSPANRRLFRDVVLKSESFERSRQLLDEAASAAQEHVATASKQAFESIAVLPDEGTGILREDRVAALADVLPGALIARDARRAGAVLLGVGVLEFPSGIAIPYELEDVTQEAGEERRLARVLGHEYLMGYGRSDEEAAQAAHDAVVGFLELLGREDEMSTPSIGVSRRLRTLLAGLSTAASDEEEEI